MKRADRVRHVPWAAGWVLWTAVTAAGPAWSASFQGLGDLPGGSIYSGATGVSSDGSIVVGNSSSSFLGGFNLPFQWTTNEGMKPVRNSDDFHFEAYASGVSGNGATVVGYVGVAFTSEAFRWSAQEGYRSVGVLSEQTPSLSSTALGTNYDGSVIVGTSVGTSGPEAFRWTATGGIEGLGDLPGGAFQSSARAVSADGSVVAGNGYSDLGSEAFRWTESGGMQELGDLPGGSYSSDANAISGDGSVIVGSSDGGSGHEAFHWTESDGMQALGGLPGQLGTFVSRANAVNSDGSVIVGMARTSSNNIAINVASIWDATNGMRSLAEVLTNDYGLDLTGWKLEEATGISANGHVIVGNGTNPSSQQEAWIAILPEPASLTLLSAGGVVIMRRRSYTVQRTGNGHPIFGFK